MKNALLSLLAGGVFLALMNAEAAGKTNISAEMCISYRILDDAGLPVPDVSCGGWIREFDAKGGGRAYLLMSDTNGVVTIRGKCSVSFTAFFMKEGYYMSRLEPCLDEDGTVSAIVGGKWQPYGEMRMVVLKKIKNPSAMLPAKGENRRGYPEDGVWAGYDLERHDWVAPIGDGVCEDMKIRFVTRRFSDVDFARTMDISFADIPHGGAYKMAADEFSEFKTVYSANTNAAYLRAFKYEFRHEGRRLVRDELAKDEYLVFRTRTTVNPDGSLKSAHYGVIMGNWKFFEPYGMGIGRTLFNPTPNDTNLEDAETARKSRLGYKQQLEFERRRKEMP